mgnify:CR=1 FL=1
MEAQGAVGVGTEGVPSGQGVVGAAHPGEQAHAGGTEAPLPQVEGALWRSEGGQAGIDEVERAVGHAGHGAGAQEEQLGEPGGRPIGGGAFEEAGEVGDVGEDVVELAVVGGDTVPCVGEHGQLDAGAGAHQARCGHGEVRGEVGDTALGEEAVEDGGLDLCCHLGVGAPERGGRCAKAPGERQEPHRLRKEPRECGETPGHVAAVARPAGHPEPGQPQGEGLAGIDEQPNPRQRAEERADAEPWVCGVGWGLRHAAGRDHELADDQPQQGRSGGCGRGMVDAEPGQCVAEHDVGVVGTTDGEPDVGQRAGDRGEGEWVGSQGFAGHEEVGGGGGLGPQLAVGARPEDAEVGVGVVGDEVVEQGACGAGPSAGQEVERGGLEVGAVGGRPGGLHEVVGHAEPMLGTEQAGGASVQRCGGVDGGAGEGGDAGVGEGPAVVLGAEQPGLHGGHGGVDDGVGRQEGEGREHMDGCGGVPDGDGGEHGAHVGGAPGEPGLEVEGEVGVDLEARPVVEVDGVVGAFALECTHGEGVLEEGAERARPAAGQSEGPRSEGGGGGGAQPGGEELLDVGEGQRWQGVVEGAVATGHAEVVGADVGQGAAAGRDHTQQGQSLGAEGQLGHEGTDAGVHGFEVVDEQADGWGGAGWADGHHEVDERAAAGEAKGAGVGARDGVGHGTVGQAGEHGRQGGEHGEVGLDGARHTVAEVDGDGGRDGVEVVGQLHGQAGDAAAGGVGEVEAPHACAGGAGQGNEGVEQAGASGTGGTGEVPHAAIAVEGIVEGAALLEVLLVSFAGFGVVLCAAQYELRALSRRLDASTLLLSGSLVDARIGLAIAVRRADETQVVWTNRAARSLLDAELGHRDVWAGRIEAAAVQALHSAEQTSVTTVGGRSITVAANAIEGDEDRFAVQLLDVTSILQAQQTQVEAEVERESARSIRAELERQRDDFLATTSHELRTPITSIVGYTELLADSEAVAPAKRGWLDVIDRNAHRLAELVEDLLTLSGGATAPTRPQHLDELSGAAVLEEVVANLRVVSDPKGIEVSIAPGDVLVLGARGDVLRAITNLLMNAIKFTPEGGRIRLAASEDDGMALLVVADTGPGMTDEELAQAFERFYRAPGAERANVAGTGLGLAIVAELARRNGGDVELARNDDGGLTAELRLPLPA